MLWQTLFPPNPYTHDIIPHSPYTHDIIPLPLPDLEQF